MIKSAIEWTETTWSPVIGCTKVSQGCKHCYAEREVDTRWSKNPKSVWFGRSFTDVLCRPDQLDVPLHWKKPRRIFVCPRADLFHEDVPFDFIDDVFAVMAMAQQHTFQVLTKRPDRMLAYLSQAEKYVRVEIRYHPQAETMQWPLKNVHIGTSIEDQPTADERIPLLLQTPAAVRWISAEPLLGPISLRWLDAFPENAPASATHPSGQTNHLDGLRRLDWLVAGGESGPDARPMHPQWVRTLRDQCATAGVPFLFKQWGEWLPARELPDNTSMTGDRWANVNAKTGAVYKWDKPWKRGGFGEEIWEVMGRVGKTKAGRLLDGVLHDAYPEVKP